MRFLEEVIVAAMLQALFQNHRKGTTRLNIARRWGPEVQVWCYQL